ncbi:MAG: hypothetical protein NXH91_03160 [Phyllobacteriaceae bacterium]|jgi:hypothetical protein|nr:hypothetical protein [Phyllobacteriaceae bacterium]
MMTQTHFLVAAALFCRPDRPARQNAAVLAGAFAPDAAIYGLYVWSKIVGIPERRLWDEVYFSEPMTTLTAIGNSAPLYALIAIIGIALVRPASVELAGPHGTVPMGFARFTAPATTNIALLFALGALTHLAGDFPVHASDAHPHFWPLTGWRFVSPVSYWDPDHFGRLFSLAEAVLGVALSVVLFRRFRTLWVRGLTLILLTAYLAVPAYFIFMLGGV